MTLKYLLDTNIVSEPLRPAPHPKILAHLQHHQTEMAIAAVVWHELLFGCYRLPPSAKRAAIENYLNQVVAPSLPILPYDQPAAEWQAIERTRFDSRASKPCRAPTAQVHPRHVSTLRARARIPAKIARALPR